MTVKFGLGWSINHMQAEFPLAELPARSAETIRVAQESGFQLVKCAHHWMAHILQPLPMIAWGAAAGPGMDFMTSIFLLPQQNPVDIAGQAATLDLITGGHFILGVGLGYREKEFMAAGMLKKERVGRLEEAIPLMRELWSGKTVTHKGRFYEVDNGGSPITPLQPGGVPIFIGAQSEVAVRRAGGLGDGWIIPGFYTKDLLREHFKLFEDGARAAGKASAGARVLMRSVVVGPTREAALEEARDWLGTQWRGQAYARWGMQEAGTPSLDLTMEEIARERAIVGTVDQVIEGIKAYVEEFDITHFIPLFRRDDTSHAEHLEQIRFYGREIFPHVAP
ncbi:MAG: LLM class flavin-dependent oxidoreductase [Chloroflexi bacterium]|nr:LLM class flavin-dependent oxidoreductase [Chloroflexota bacterium]